MPSTATATAAPFDDGRPHQIALKVSVPLYRWLHSQVSRKRRLKSVAALVRHVVDEFRNHPEIRLFPAEFSQKAESVPFRQFSVLIYGDTWKWLCEFCKRNGFSHQRLVVILLEKKRKRMVKK